MDDIIYGAPLGPRVLSAKPIDDYMLLIKFNNGEERIFDAKPLFIHNVFKPLQDKLFFDLVKVAYGTVEWPNDIDYCPDTLYSESIPVSNKDYDSIGFSAVAESQQIYNGKD